MTLMVIYEALLNLKKGMDPHFNTSRPNPERREKLSQIFIFTLICGASEGFIKAFKAFIKPFEASQRSVKII